MKTNFAGRQCPDWCTTDHEAPGRGRDACRKDAAPIPIRKGSSLGFRAYPYLPAYSDEASVMAGGLPGMVIAASADDAKDLAALVEGLSETTPARIRQFAAQIREAETLAFAGQEPQPHHDGPDARTSEQRPRTYITEISVPRLGDNGVQRLRSHMKDPEPQPEPAVRSEPEPEAGL